MRNKSIRKYTRTGIKMDVCLTNTDAGKNCNTQDKESGHHVAAELRRVGNGRFSKRSNPCGYESVKGFISSVLYICMPHPPEARVGLPAVNSLPLNGI